MQLNAYEPVGLKASGNSCYMNSLLQILASIEPLRQHLSSIEVNYYKKNESMFRQNITRDPSTTDGIKQDTLKNLYSHLLLADSIVDTMRSITEQQQNASLHAVSSEDVWRHLKPIMARLTGRAQGSQEDASEAMQQIIQTIESGTLNNAMLIDHYDGQSYHYIITPVGYNDPSKGFVKLNNFEEILRKEVSPFESVQKRRLPSISPYFTTLLRRSYKDENNNDVKDHTPIDFPLTINMHNITEKVQGGSDYIYHLHAIAVHHGEGTQSGHYTTYIRGQDSWYDCNDSRVKRVDQKTVLDNIARTAYLIMYKQGIAPQFKTAEKSSQTINNQQYPQNNHSISKNVTPIRVHLHQLSQALNKLARALKRS